MSPQEDIPSWFKENAPAAAPSDAASSETVPSWFKENAPVSRKEDRPRPLAPPPPLPEGLQKQPPVSWYDPKASFLSNYASAMAQPIRWGMQGLERVQRGAEQIAGAWQPNLPSEPQTTPGRKVAGGVSEMIRGAGQSIGAPATVFGLATAPVATGVGLAAAGLTGAGIEKGAEASGLAKKYPEYTALLSDVASTVAGAFGPKVTAGLLSRMKVSIAGPVAELVKFADEHGIPLSAAARTGMERIRQWQARTATSKAAQRSQAGTQAGLARTAEELRGPAPQMPPGPTGGTRESAAGGVVEELRTRRAKYAAGEKTAYTRLEELEAANQQEVVTGTRRTESTMIDPATNRPHVHEEPITERIGLPVNLKPAKSRLGALLAPIEQQLPPALREASIGLQGIRNLVDAPDTVSATIADGYLSAVKTLLRERNINPKSRRLLRLALDEVSPAVDQAVAQGGPEATQALGEGRALTAAKYAVEKTMRLARVPKADEFPLEPLRLYRKFTAAGDVNIGLLQRIQQHAPDSIPAVGRALLEGLFDSALGRDGKLDPMAALKAWNKLGDSTKRILFQQVGRVTALDGFFRQQARHNFLGDLFELDPTAALKKWNALDDGTKRMIFQPRDIPEVGRFLRLAEMEAKTPRATPPGQVGTLADAIGKLNEHVRAGVITALPEIAGLLTGHESLGRKASGTILGLRIARAGLQQVGAITSNALSRALWNPATARALTEGIRVPSLSVPAGAAAAAGARGVLAPSASRPSAAVPSTTRRPAPSAPSERKPSAFAPARGLAPEIRSLLAKASRQYGVPLDMLTHVASRETGGLRDPATAVSPKGAVGVMQLMPATAADYGLRESDLTDPAKSIDASARILRDLLKRYNGDRTLALAAYNAGPGAVQKYGGVPPYKETQKYVR